MGIRPVSGGVGDEGGLRARKKAATRDCLISVALALCAESTYAATTVEAIAEAAGVSTRTFFHYFPTKQDVFLGHERDLLAGSSPKSNGTVALACGCSVVGSHRKPGQAIRR